MKKDQQRCSWHSIYCYQNIKEDHPRFGWYYVGRTHGKNQVRNHWNEGLLSEDLQSFSSNIVGSVIWTGECTPEEIDRKEKYYIKEYNCVSPNGYNRNYGGGGVVAHTEETKEKMRKPKSEKGRINIKIAANQPGRNAKIFKTRRANGNLQCSEETIEKMREVQKIAQNRPEVKEKKRKATIKQFQDPEARERARRTTIRQFQDPEARERRKNQTVEQWEDPEMKKRMRKAIKVGQSKSEVREKMRAAKKGKTWEEIYGVEGAAKRRANMSGDRNPRRLFLKKQRGTLYN